MFELLALMLVLLAYVAGLAALTSRVQPRVLGSGELATGIGVPDPMLVGAMLVCACAGRTEPNLPPDATEERLRAMMGLGREAFVDLLGAARFELNRSDTTARWPLATLAASLNAALSHGEREELARLLEDVLGQRPDASGSLPTLAALRRALGLHWRSDGFPGLSGGAAVRWPGERP